MQRTWHKLTHWGVLALCTGCGQDHEVPRKSDESQTEAAPFRNDPKSIRMAVPCGAGFGVNQGLSPDRDFGSWRRAHWRIANEESPFFRPPDVGHTFLWRGAQASTLALNCSLTWNDCETGGSRLQLEDSTGGALFVHVYWEPEELPDIALGTRLRLEVDMGRGVLVLTSEEGELQLAIVRYGGAQPREALSWTLGTFSVTADHAVCTATMVTCNYRLTTLALRIAAAGRSVVLAPGENTALELDGASYRVANDMAALNGIADERQFACSAVRINSDAISVLRE